MAKKRTKKEKELLAKSKSRLLAAKFKRRILLGRSNARAKIYKGLKKTKK